MSIEAIKAWAHAPEEEDTPWNAGYEAARRWVMMQLVSAPKTASDSCIQGLRNVIAEDTKEGVSK